MTERKFLYYPLTERLIIETAEGEGAIREEKAPIDRDTWGNPFFNVEQGEKSHWIQFTIWPREKGKPEQYKVLRGFYKCIKYTEQRQITTYYCQEQNYQAKGEKKPIKDDFIFTFNFGDITGIRLDAEGEKEWYWKNRPGEPKLPD